MKKALLIIALSCIALSMLGAAGTQEQMGDQSLQKVLDKGVFVLGLDDSFPPMGYRNENNEIVGFDIDLAKEVTKRMGVQLKLQPIDWNAKEQELNTGNIDCIWNGFTITEERSQVINFTDPYVDNAQVAVVRSDSPVQSLGDLAGKKVGLQAGSSAADAVNGNEAFANSLDEIVEVKDNLTALMDLEIGGVDAVVLDLFVANDNIKRSGKDFRILDEHLSSEKYGIGFRKNDQALRDEVQKTLEAMAADGTLAKISTDWFGGDITVIGK
ncbi:amino acid ABC transporter substrate-binding protein [Pleomorphochaeta sp. DL1XJH-081]|uniref:amino acid ABC transporter substrate-binding protein n=1 Tax=Pleomorphochaeta sp. DL1XJH-081 TaxID=3409690 RepID=UPI003BB62622